MVTGTDLGPGGLGSLGHWQQSVKHKWGELGLKTDNSANNVPV